MSDLLAPPRYLATIGKGYPLPDRAKGGRATPDTLELRLLDFTMGESTLEISGHYRPDTMRGLSNDY